MFRTFLFGRFHAERHGQPVAGLDAARAQELLGYLLLNRARPHPRLALAALLWSDLPEPQARQYLRKTLWQLSVAINGSRPSPRELLAIEPEWVQLALDERAWLDVAQFEAAYERARDVPGQELAPGAAAELADAVALYRGDLLEGWYQDWCVFERERLERMYLIMLDKLMIYSESRGQYESGVAYGTLALRRDRARERTHRRLMRLHYLSGNRSEALRQFRRCAAALREELDVAPARQTRLLYERLLTDDGLDAAGPLATADPLPLTAEAAARQLEQLAELLSQMQQRVRQQLEALGGQLTPPV